MKKKIVCFMVCLHTMLGTTTLFGQLGVGTRTPDASSELHIASTTRGALLPRMSSVQMNAISTPATGLLVYCNDCAPAGLHHFNGSAWVAITDLNYQNNSFSNGDDLGNHTATQNINLNDKKLVGDSGTVGITITKDGKVGIATKSTPAARLLLDSVTTSVPGLQIGRNMGVGQSNTQILAGVSPGDRAFRLITANPSNGYFINMLTHNMDYTGNQYTQGNWGGSSSIEFHSGNIVFKNDSQISAGSSDNISPSTSMTLSEGNYVRLSSGSWVKAFSDDATLGGNNDSLVPTARAVKAYVDNSGGLIIDNTTKRNIQGGQLNFRNLSGGTDNLALGYQALDSVTTGASNVAVGPFAGLNATTASNNTFLGSSAGRLTTSGVSNVAVGNGALHNNTTGHSNVAIGASAGSKTTSGIGNVYIGIGAGQENTAHGSVMIGENSGFNSKGQYSVYLGYQAGFYDTTLTNGARLMIENSNSLSPLIGGDFSRNKVGINMHIDSLNQDDRATLQVGGDMQLQNGVKIDEFSTDGTLAGNSDDAVPTEKAVKAYVDSIGPALQTNFSFNPATHTNVYEQYLGNFSTTSGPIEIKIGDRGNNHFGGAYIRVIRPYNEPPIVTYQERGSGGDYRVGYRIIDYTKFELYLINTVASNAVAHHEVQVDCPNGNNYNPAGIVQSNTGIDTAEVRHYVDVRQGLQTTSLGTYAAGGATLNVNGTLKLEEGQSVKKFSTDNALGGGTPADDVIPTEKAVKDYVDGRGFLTVESQDLQLSGNTLSITNDASTVDLTPYLDADDLGDHTATANLNLGTNKLVGGGTQGISIASDGKLNMAFGTGVNEFSTDGTLADDSDDAVPTEKAVRNYVNSQGFLKTETQDLQLSGNTLSITNDASTVDLSHYLDADNLGNHAATSDLHLGNYKLVGAGTQGISIASDGKLNMVYGTGINEFSTDEALSGNSNDAVPTERAVRSFVSQNRGAVATHVSNVHGNTNNYTQITSGAQNNAALGQFASKDLTTGDNNVAFGYDALQKMTTGSNNVAVGRSAGLWSNGSDNVFLGSYAGLLETGSGKLYIDPSFDNSTPLIGGDFYGNRVGINRAITNLSSGATFQVGGDASKSTAGSWSANSDSRLKTNIHYMDSEAMLQSMLRMRGATYEWNDTVTGTPRPEGIQYGFIAQDIEKVWPSKITHDGQGYLMTAYGDYDPMFVESIRALYNRIKELEKENAELKANSKEELQSMMERISKLEDMMKAVVGEDISAGK